MKKATRLYPMLVLCFLLPVSGMAQMQTKSGDFVVSIGASYSDFSLGFNGDMQYNITDKLALHPAFNYNTLGNASFISVDAWGAWHGISNIPAINRSADGLDNVDAYVMLGPTYYLGDLENGFAFGGGGGARYYFNSKMAVTLEGKYRMIIGQAYSYIRWYDFGVGLSYGF